MSVFKQALQIAIGLVVFGLSMVTNVLPWDSRLELIRVLQFTATIVLLFGVLRAHPQHLDKFMLFWMVITSVCFIAMLYAGLLHLCHGHSSLYILLPWSSAAFMAPLLNVIYNHYVDLTVGAEETNTEVLQTKLSSSYEAKGPLNMT
ncbi:uncharacterized protein LOC116805017 [Drosophila grimshawi]|uniref:uncharacterized protein LOC116805017 n=1 Tax=Drosophila grimshawi TaxID=7222 RepID=UPI000C871309|nr:uncharacterized protein LOC116805017 [Drosophila grimshawi]